MDSLVEKWLDKVLMQQIPETVVALNFNLYEDAENHKSMELVGTSRFDPDDADWACDEVFDFGTRAHPFVWQTDDPFDVALDKMTAAVKQYLAHGSHAHILKRYQGIGIGFIDGDIDILFDKGQDSK